MQNQERTKDQNDVHYYLEQLKQLRKLTWDGNLIAKDHRDWLVENEYAEQGYGWNWISNKGVKFLVEEKYIAP